MLARIEKKGGSHIHCLWECKSVCNVTSLEIGVKNSQKTKNKSAL